MLFSLERHIQRCEGEGGETIWITGNINTESPYLQSPVGNGIFCSTKVTFQHNTVYPELVKFQAPSYHKLIRQLERAQKTREMVQVPNAMTYRQQNNGRAGGAVMIWRVDEQGKIQHLQKLQTCFCIFQIQERLLQKEKKNMFSVSRVTGMQNSHNQTYLVANV